MCKVLTSLLLRSAHVLQRLPVAHPNPTPGQPLHRHRRSFTPHLTGWGSPPPLGGLHSLAVRQPQLFRRRSRPYRHAWGRPLRRRHHHERRRHEGSRGRRLSLADAARVGRGISLSRHKVCACSSMRRVAIIIGGIWLPSYHRPNS